jgi:hypothetical protein
VAQRRPLTTDTAANRLIPNPVPIVSLPEEDVPCESDVTHMQKASPEVLFDINRDLDLLSTDRASVVSEFSFKIEETWD